MEEWQQQLTAAEALYSGPFVVFILVLFITAALAAFITRK